MPTDHAHHSEPPMAGAATPGLDTFIQGHMRDLEALAERPRTQWSTYVCVELLALDAWMEPEHWLQLLMLARSMTITTSSLRRQPAAHPEDPQ